MRSVRPGWMATFLDFMKATELAEAGSLVLLYFCMEFFIDLSRGSNKVS